ncbi:MAG: 2,4-dienoyl-CoA reductase [Candidatus Aminicenantes bacterium]|nr:2,4-dienoyl-CoA reductase [Candidatus Aminicenantes bacterium]
MRASVLFTPLEIGPIKIPNRFVRSATHDFMSGEDGSVTDRQVALFRRLAEGEVGLIITGHAYINPAGKASPRQIGVHDDRMVDGLSRIPRSVHDFPTRIFLQIAHAGRQTKEKICGCVPAAPSAVYDPVFKLLPRAMARDEIRGTIDEFVQAGRRAKQAGFDGVQIHVAHGYLLSSFISPHTNRREDEYGGSLENRARIVREILRGIKSLAGPCFPVIAKLNSQDFLPGGLFVEESIEIARALEADGLDGVEVSGGMSEAGKGSVWEGLRTEQEEGYFVDSASRFKAAVGIPVFGLGGLRTFAVMERAVAEGRVDLISLSRPLIREPGLVKKFRLGEVPKSECISCNTCFNPRGIECGDLAIARRKKAVQ